MAEAKIERELSTARPAVGASATQDRRVITVALVGSPNVGKSTIFNLLTGLSQHVGNWPGKTIEKKTGIHHGRQADYWIVDLPGTYSLTANSLEEQVTRDYIAREKPDVVVAVLNAAGLERNLYLLSEVLELPAPVVVALNMIDVAEERGVRVEPEVLAAALGVPVLPVVASRNQGLRELLKAIDEIVAVERLPNQAESAPRYRPKRAWLGEELESLVSEVESLVGEKAASPYPLRWAAQKLLEGDREIMAQARDRLDPEVWAKLEALLYRNEEAVVTLASARYEWVERMVRAAVHRPQTGAISLTERVDRLTTHPQLGPLVLLGLLGLIFWAVYVVAEPLVAVLEDGFEVASEVLTDSMTGAPEWLVDLLADGVLGGVGAVMALLPILIVFFLAMAVLEDVGYMARAAFVADRYMHRMGLHGKSFLPLLLGFGCNVPAALGTRIIESPQARLLTVLLVPLVPCAARLGILILVASAFFGPSAPLVAMGIVALNLSVLAVTGYLTNRLLFRGDSPPFIMELPLYQRPNWRTIGTTVYQRTREFVVRAGTVILLASVCVWILASLPDGEIDTSYLALVGQQLAPLGSLMGLDWRMMVSLLSSFVAKENAIATMAVLSNVDGEANLSAALPSILTPAAAVAFLAVQTLFIPCVATVAAMRQELWGWRWLVMGLAYLSVVSFAAGILIFQIARLVGWGV